MQAHLEKQKSISRMKFVARTIVIAEEDRRSQKVQQCPHIVLIGNNRTRKLQSRQNTIQM